MAVFAISQLFVSVLAPTLRGQKALVAKFRQVVVIETEPAQGWKIGAVPLRCSGDCISIHANSYFSVLTSAAAHS